MPQTKKIQSQTTYLASYIKDDVSLLMQNKAINLTTMNCTNGSSTSDDQNLQNRRSANYKPNIWDYNRLQSLKSDYVVSEIL